MTLMNSSTLLNLVVKVHFKINIYRSKSENLANTVTTI